MTVMPSGGALASKSVAILYPSAQQLRVRAVFVHAPSDTCLSMREAGMALAKASEPADSQ